LLWTRRDLHITVPWASSLVVLSWNETSTVTINMFEYDSLFYFISLNRIINDNT
jgi:hypothetical protein